jgi:hypothetical protein
MRFRKSIKIAPGIKLNLSKSGVSTTIGKKGLSVNVGERGTYLNTGIPGTGVYNRQRLDGAGGSDTETDEQYLKGDKIEEGDPPAPKEPIDIPKAKKKRRNRFITASVLLVFSIITFPTILGGIAFLVGALFFLLAGLVINGDIYQAEHPSPKAV